MARRGNLSLLIRKCRLNPEEAEELLYDSFFDYAKGICAEYSCNRFEQLDIVKLGFKKAVKYIHHFNTDTGNRPEDFKVWIKKMMIYAAFEYFRKNLKLSYFPYSDSLEIFNKMKGGNYKGGMLAQNVETAMAQLPLSNRIIIHLTTMQGFSEQDLARCLEISKEKAESLLNETTARFYQLLLAAKEAIPGGCPDDLQEEVIENSMV